MVAAQTPWWALAWPAAGWATLLMTVFLDGGLIAGFAGFALLGTVFAAVYHAEIVAHRIGEPFGTLVLALAVTVIETALDYFCHACRSSRKRGTGARHRFRSRHDRVQWHRWRMPIVGRDPPP